MDPQLHLFRRQYLQLFEPDFLSWPPKQLLRDPDAQAWLYKNLFDAERNPRLPSERYQLRVLKPLLAKIEQAIEDPEEDVGIAAVISISPNALHFLFLFQLPAQFLISSFVRQEISDELMTCLSTLIASNLPSEATAAQQKEYVTFSCLPPSSAGADVDSADPTITLLERRHLISGSQTTGFRTWEAALHLGSYLLQPSHAHLTQNKSIIELGAGTGFLSILCAKHLGSKHVTATDGDEGVVEALKENLFLNGLEDSKGVQASVLRWGRGLKGTWAEEECEEFPYDLVIGADIVRCEPPKKYLGMS